MTHLSDRLGPAVHSRWEGIAAELADRAPLAAEAFIESTPLALAHLEPEELETWGRLGRRLCRGGWKSTRLAARFFRISPGLLDSISLRVLEQLVELWAAGEGTVGSEPAVNGVDMEFFNRRFLKAGSSKPKLRDRASRPNR